MKCPHHISFSLSLSDWCYQSQFTCAQECNGPDKWNHANSACAGKSQSPINVVTRKTLKDERLTPFEFTNYQQIFRGTIKNNGHSVQVAVPHLSTISGGGLPSTYKAVQFHLHWGINGGPGSEHTIDGEQYPMEVPYQSFKKKKGSVLAICVHLSSSSSFFFVFLNHVSCEVKLKSITVVLMLSLFSPDANTSLPPTSLAQLIPPEHNLTSFYRYRGSLTTPGCIEAVVWTLFENPIPLSFDQLRAFSELKFRDGKPMVGTFRPVQPLNGRQVYRSGGAVLLVSSNLLMAALATALGLSRLY
uniref:Carbonic anhydrase 4 n=1 Tax=Hippocampus comes TaxID=109280 RepID=A0A3Q3DWX4_HIPCM